MLKVDPPSWVSWKSSDNFLPAAFFDQTSDILLSAFNKWITTDPITTEDNYLVSYQQLERVALGFGLAFQALWIAQFSDSSDNVPAYILEGPYLFTQYEQLSYQIENLIAGYEETYVNLFSLPFKMQNTLSRLVSIEGNNSPTSRQHLTSPKKHSTNRNPPHVSGQEADHVDLALQSTEAEPTTTQQQR